LVTVALRVTESAPSTVLAEAVTATLGEGELPPQPVKREREPAATPSHSRAHVLRNITDLQRLESFFEMLRGRKKVWARAHEGA
jgi:hypothetical protein